MDEIGGWGVDARAFRDALSRLGETENIHLRIHSPGGSITDGNEIYNALKERKGQVRVTLGALCASIATVVAMAGAPVAMAANGFFMIHNPWVCTDGDSEDLRKKADIMDKMKGGIIATYAAKTGLSETELSELMDEETWMTAAEAKEKGFVDEIIDEEAEDDEAQDFDLTRFKNAAKFLSKLQGRNASPDANAAGNRAPVVTLQDLEKAEAKTRNVTPKNNTQMTPEEIKAQAKAEAEKLFKARMARDKEIRDIVASVKDRDKKDFAALADKYLTDPQFEDKTVNDFAMALVTSKEFKDVGDVVGAGEESYYGGRVQVIEPLDSLRGTPGYDFVTSPAFRAMHEQVKARGTHQNVNLSIETRGFGANFRNTTQTSTATSGSGLTSIQKQPGIVDLGVRPLTIEDLVMPGQTGATTIRLMQEVSYTQAAAAVTETGPLANFGVTYTEVDFPVKDMGGYIEASENLLADYLAIGSLINTRLPYQVDRIVEDEIFNGAGSGAHLTGILQTSGIQTLALGVIPRADFPLKLQTLIRWQNMSSGQAQGGYEPDAYVIHPTDWETIQLLKDNNGQYYWRGPFQAIGANGDLVEFYTLWGKKVVVSPVTAQGTIVCGAFKMGAQKFDRQGMVIEMTNANGTNFINRLITIRGTRRLALAVYRPGNFATGTGF